MAKKASTVFFCTECGNETSKWMGQCPACKAWNTLVEEPVSSSGNRSSVKKVSGSERKAYHLSDISMDESVRQSTGIAEMDRVLGGGIVHGSLTLLGGDPGIGKSTLLLQMCENISRAGKKVLYISGEESLQQIKLRAQRLGSFGDDLLLMCENDLTDIEAVIRRESPEVVIIDSIRRQCFPGKRVHISASAAG